MLPIKFAKKYLLLVCLTLASPVVFADDSDCTELSKEVSIDGGVTWFAADSAATAPTQVVGGRVSFRFVIRNCSTTNTWNNIQITDQTIGLSRTKVRDSNGDNLVLEPLSDEFIITEHNEGFEILNQPNLCDTAGLKTNRVKLKVTDGTDEKVVFYDHGCVICEEGGETAELGDRVWEDLDIDGIQDCEDTNGNGIIGDAGDTGPECGTGIPDLPVNLLAGDCTTPLGQTVMTDPDGFYLFPNLVPGDYCVEFVPPGDDFCDTSGYDLGTPQFTLQNEGVDDAVDSDADTTTGISDSVSLAAGDSNLTVDAGIYCPAKVGDFVWFDDGNGIQDGGEGGVEGVAVHLWDCGPDGESGTTDDIDLNESRFTDSDGLYMFGAEPGVYDLQPGNYFVQFVQPIGYEFTTPKQGGDDATDSDCLAPRGRTACTGNLGSRSVNLKRDCGIIPPPSDCELTLNKTCLIPSMPPPPPPPSDGKCEGRLEQFTVIWTGDTIDVSGVDNDAPGGVVNNNQAVTFFGPFDKNDVKIGISGAASGESKFHLSCSDSDFNTADDCGKAAGDGKNNKKKKKGKKEAALLNDWLVDGWIDGNGAVLSCSGDDTGGGSGGGDDEFPTLDSCELSLEGGGSCDELGKPKVLTFAYTGGTCPGANSQGSKTKCDDFDTLSNTVQIIATGKDSDKIVFVPDAFVTLDSADNSFTISRSDGKDLSASTVFELHDDMGNKLQTLDIHTSCSVALTAGDVFGGLTLAAFGDSSGSSSGEVIYGYTITNNGDLLTGINLTDDKLGDIAGPFDLAFGETMQFTVATSLLATTTNTATASGFLPGGGSCAATDTVVVEVITPDPDPDPTGLSCDDGKPATLIFEYTGEDCSASSHDQGSKVSCSGDLNGHGPVMINYIGKNAKKIGVSPEAESINVGDLVTLDAGSMEKLKAESELEITQGGVLLQTIEFHTSCSKPLAEGDQFGSLILKTFIPEDKK